MTTKLKEFGITFATRERARQLAGAATGVITHVDLDGVLCSPSFLAEFFVLLTAVSPITVTATDRAMADKAERLATQLGLAQKVTVQFAVSA